MGYSLAEDVKITDKKYIDFVRNLPEKKQIKINQNHKHFNSIALLSIDLVTKYENKTILNNNQMHPNKIHQLS